MREGLSPVVNELGAHFTLPFHASVVQCALVDFLLPCDFFHAEYFLDLWKFRLVHPNFGGLKLEFRRERNISVLITMVFILVIAEVEVLNPLVKAA